MRHVRRARQTNLIWYTDRLYTRVALAREMLRHEQYLCSTYDGRYGIPEDAKIPSKKPTRANPRGTLRAAHTSDGISLWGLMDNGRVYFLDTAHGGATTEQECLEKDGSTTFFDMPKCREEFGKYMGGTDAFDQMNANRKGFACTAFNVKTRKWTLRLGGDGMFDILAGNAWCVARACDPSADHMTHVLEAAEHFFNASQWIGSLAAEEQPQVTRRVSRASSASASSASAAQSSAQADNSMCSPSNTEHANVRLPGAAMRCAWCMMEQVKSAATVKGCASCLEHLHDGRCHLMYHRARMNAGTPKVCRRVVNQDDKRRKRPRAD